MKKALKILGILALVLIVFLLIGFIYIKSSEIPSYEVQTVSFTASGSPQAIERGQKLTTMLCANCHKSPTTGKLSGTQMLDAPKEFGEIHSANITNDKTYGIGSYTDGELVYLLRTGIKRNGQYAPPYMAKLPHMADADIDAIISFLRSDNPLVQGVAEASIPTSPGFLTKLLCRIAWKPFPMPEKAIPMPDTNNTTELGKYLAHNLDCFSCHSADFKTNNFMQPELSVGYFAGGNKPLDKEVRVMLTPNLTPDQATGIGKWTEDQFVQAVKFGFKEGEHALVYPMTPYLQLTDPEVKAIFAYLQTIPPITNKVERSLYD